MSSAQKILRGSASNVARLILSMLVAVVLPPVLVHHLSQAEYSAWVLILQLSAYVNLLDLGLQTVVSKLVSENHARQHHETNRSMLSTAVGLLGMLSLVGLGLVLILVWRVPAIFHQMPASLFPQVRLGLLVLGASAAIALPFSPFMAVFAGLQEYGYPTLLALAVRLLSVLLLVGLALRGGTLVQLSSALAFTNVLSAALQFYGWRRYARSRVQFRFLIWDRAAASVLAGQGGIIALWSLGGVLVSGLDTVIVGHFDYVNTGFYAVAASATNAMVLLVSSLFSPLLPAVSARQATATREEIGQLTLRVSRYCAVTLCAINLPLLVFAYPLLVFWMGPEYARRSVLFLDILVVANSVRQIGYPYSQVVIATGQQRKATLATISEALVNFVVSLTLVRHLGAVGVAWGTLCGSCVSLGLHFAVSMPRTRSAVEMTAPLFLRKSLLRPSICVLPLLILLVFRRADRLLHVPASALILWALSTLALLVLVGLSAADRSRLLGWWHVRFQGTGINRRRAGS